MMDSEQARTAKTFDAYKDVNTRTVDESLAFTGMSADFFYQGQGGLHS
jgi:hypothetical protein